MRSEWGSQLLGQSPSFYILRKAAQHIGALAFIHRFGSSLNGHVHFHVCTVDGVFEEVPGIVFHPASAIDATAVAQVQTVLRRRILRAFVGRGLIEQAAASRCSSVSAGQEAAHPCDRRDWKEVIWALTTCVDPLRDTMLVENTPIDYLDFASPVSGLGSKMGLDATNKWPGETQREWGRTITMDAQVQQRMDGIFVGLGL